MSCTQSYLNLDTWEAFEIAITISPSLQLWFDYNLPSPLRSPGSPVLPWSGVKPSPHSAMGRSVPLLHLHTSRPLRTANHQRH